jgi:hypothetical protein
MTRAAPHRLSLSVIRPARDDDVLPAFRRRCLCARAAPARRMAHSAQYEWHESAGMLVTAVAVLVAVMAALA